MNFPRQRFVRSYYPAAQPIDPAPNCRWCRREHMADKACLMRPDPALLTPKLSKPEAQ